MTALAERRNTHLRLSSLINLVIFECFVENDRVTFDRLMDQFEGKVAAAIMEGVQSRDVDKEFLQRMRARTCEDGALLIFDEIVSGFRLAVGGAHEWSGIDVDLVTFGKGMGNGTPISVLAGSSSRKFCVGASCGPAGTP